MPAVTSSVGRDTPATVTLPGIKVRPAGSESDKTTLAALAVPALVTVTEYKILSPATAPAATVALANVILGALIST